MSEIIDSSKESPPRKACGSCQRPDPGTLRCKGCKKTYYCSKACQKADWHASHKRTCRWAPDITIDFLRLPPEIRDRIYGLALIAPAKDTPVPVHYTGNVYDDDPYRYHSGSRGIPLTERRWLDTVQHLNLNLLLGSRQLAREAAAVFYAGATFAFLCRGDWSLFYLFLMQIGPTNRGHLRRLKVTMPAPLIITRDDRRDVVQDWRSVPRIGFRDALPGSGKPPPDGPVDTLGSSVAACLATFGRAGPPVALELDCFGWGPVREASLHFEEPRGHCASRYAFVARTTEHWRRQHIAAPDGTGTCRVELVWTGWCDAKRFREGQAAIRRQGWEILPPRKEDVEHAEGTTNGLHSVFKLRRRAVAGAKTKKLVKRPARKVKAGT